MSIQLETVIFIKFVGIGMLFGILFDFFRAIRKNKKTSPNLVTIQDIIYFLIIGIILVLIVINVNDEVFRLYLMLAIVLGIITYCLIIGNKVRDVFAILINSAGGLLEFIFLPIKIQIIFWSVVGKNIKKYVNLCCKKKSDMIEFYQKKIKKVNKRKKATRYKRRKRVEK